MEAQLNSSHCNCLREVCLKYCELRRNHHNLKKLMDWINMAIQTNGFGSKTKFVDGQRIFVLFCGSEKHSNSPPITLKL